jgi:hypothetical protein
MKVIELWQYTHWDEVRQKRIRTRYVLTDEDAKARLIDPERVPGTREMRSVPESRDEWTLASGFLQGSTRPFFDPPGTD